MQELHTYIYVQGHVDAGAVFSEILNWDLMFSNRKDSPEDIGRHYGEDDQRGCEYVSVKDEEPLAAFLAMWYRTGGDAVTEEDKAEWEGAHCGSPNCTSHLIAPCRLLIGMSTPMSYVDTHREWNAGNLHSALIWQLGAWLDGQKVPWQWHANITGEVRTGYSELDDLAKVVHLRNTTPMGALAEMLRAMGLRVMGDQ